MREVTVIGAGLAGSEAAYQLAKRGIKVKLYEMKPNKFTEVHKDENCGELVCSNSLGSNLLTSASGLMKEELRYFGSLLIEIADKTKVPAGQALAVDRDIFAAEITKKLKEHENIEIINEEITEIPRQGYVIVATGPLSSESISNDIKKIIGEDYLYFYDAVAPIIEFDSINKEKVYFQSRYDKGEGEYINCPMNKEEYDDFYNELINAERLPLKSFEKEKLFEACMPVEKIASRGEKTLLFGPLKPKGLTNPKTGEQDHAVVQLRQDNKEGSLYNMVGFQTNLKWGEQKRVFSMIPGLENAEFVRYGVMHRNTFINSPELLNKDLSLKKDERLFFAGQITGSEGYVAAIGTGFLAAYNIIQKMDKKEALILEDLSQTGALVKYITEPVKNFQPMGPNFGIMRKMEKRIKEKRDRYIEISKIAIDYLKTVKLD